MSTKKFILFLLFLFLILAGATAGFWYWYNQQIVLKTTPASNQPTAALPESLPVDAPFYPGTGSLPQSPKAVTPTVSLIAVGDIMLSRNVAQKIKSNQDYNYPFLKTADILANADLTFGNLETAITLGRAIMTGEMYFRSDPTATAGLQYAGIDVVSLANNHSPNFGETGLKDTFKYLTAAGIDYVGAGTDKITAHTPVIKEVNGLKIAFLAYTADDVIPVNYQAGDARAGVAILDIPLMKEDVTKAKAQADLVIVSMHAGVEYQALPSQSQINFARAAIDAGASLVIGHHPHVVETLEHYKNGWIIYSLGNFVFDQMWSQETREGLIAKIFLDSQGVTSLEFIPVTIDDYSQPRLAEGIEKDVILKGLRFELVEGKVLVK
ncbi:MAG TPA: capsular biosynthesis protein [Candidatus Jacksonbacteria bacterium]|nr:MAG: hypothetical protein A2550_03335 [Candidatus Jacksonbacteria bacterium RIFOXYD2_FULL_43_21]HBH45928.1 capsular biosynthesis protein [Candidatus Jacksonbacteria bacterium]HCE49482.1 capsular biosynthesis protein [Candidatus Jacksonbacteria bacterium]